MMSKIRKQLKSTAFKIVLWAVGFSIVGASSLIIFFKNIISRKPTIDVAFVNDLVISRSQFARTLFGFENFYKMVPQLFPNLKKENLVSFVLENILIQNKVFQSKAEEIGIKAGENYICSKLKNKNFMLSNFANLLNSQVYKDNRIDKKEMLESLKAQNMTIDQFEDLIKEKLETDLFQNLILNSIYIPNYLIVEKYIKDYSKRKFSILSIKLDNYLKKVESKKLDESEIENYFNENKEIYRVPEKRSVTLWTFDPENYNISLIEDEIEKYYENLKDKDGKSLHDLRSDIEKNLRLEKFKKEFNLDVKKIIFESNDNILNKFIKEKNAIKSDLNNLNFDSNNILSKKVFNLAKISDKSFYQNENKGYIVELKSIVESYIPELKDIKDKVLKDIYIEKAKEELNLDLEKFIKSKESLENIEKYTKDINSVLEKTDWVEFNKNSKITNEDIPNSIFKKLFEVNQKIKYIGSNGYLIELDAIQDFDQKDFDDKKEKIKYKLVQEQTQAIETDLRESWRREAKILINTELFSNKSSNKSK